MPVLVSWLSDVGITGRRTVIQRFGLLAAPVMAKLERPTYIFMQRRRRGKRPYCRVDVRASRMQRAGFTGLRTQLTTRRRHSELIHQCDQLSAALGSAFVRAVLPQG
jgi:hypothetical protein